VLPSTMGSAGQVLSTNGASQTSWINAPAASQWANVAAGISYASGSVGIGVANPTSTFHIQQNGNSMTSMSLVNSTSGPGAFTQFVSGGAGSNSWLYNFSSGFTSGGRFIAGSTLLDATGGLGLSALGGPMQFYTNSGVEAMRITSGGSVGIGTTSPSSLLHIHNVGVSNVFTVSDNDKTWLQGIENGVGNSYSIWEDISSGVNNRLQILSGGSIIMATNGGSIGVGVSTPTSKLTVAGTIESSSGGYKFPDGTVQTQAVTGATAAYASSVQGALTSTTSTSYVDISTLAPAVIAVKNGDIVKADLQCNGYNISNYVIAILVLTGGSANTLATPNFQYSFNPSANWNALNSQGLFQATATGNLTFSGRYRIETSGTGFVNGCSLIAVRIGH
jgi:hypothetical protein